MDIIEGILTRRSIRKYTGEKISEEQLKTILRAGFQAPSARNRQPWHFIVVRDRNKLESIAQAHPYAKMLPEAGCGIIVCGDNNVENSLGNLVEDCSAAIQNILLAAHGLGLGAVWCGLYPVTERTNVISDLFDLPQNIIPVGLAVVGHKNEEKEVVDRYAEERIHYDRW